MKFMLKDLKMGQQVQTIRGWEIDPDWRHTSTKGTVYRYDKKGKGFVPPPSDARSVHVDCPDPALCGGCDGWDETQYIDDAGDRFIPGTPRAVDPVELWGYFGAFDHVLLAWLWGPMAALPLGMPMLTLDVKQLALGQGSPALPPMVATMEHNALWDARWVRDAWAQPTGAHARAGS